MCDHPIIDLQSTLYYIIETRREVFKALGRRKVNVVNFPPTAAHQGKLVLWWSNHASHTHTHTPDTFACEHIYKGLVSHVYIYTAHTGQFACMRERGLCDKTLLQATNYATLKSEFRPLSWIYTARDDNWSTLLSHERVVQQWTLCVCMYVCGETARTPFPRLIHSWT